MECEELGALLQLVRHQARGGAVSEEEGSRGGGEGEGGEGGRGGEGDYGYILKGSPEPASGTSPLRDGSEQPEPASGTSPLRGGSCAAAGLVEWMPCRLAIRSSAAASTASTAAFTIAAASATAASATAAASCFARDATAAQASEDAQEPMLSWTEAEAV